MRNQDRAGDAVNMNLVGRVYSWQHSGFDPHCIAWEWWYVPVTPECGKWREEDMSSKSPSATYEASSGYMRPSQRKGEEKRDKREGERRKEDIHIQRKQPFSMVFASVPALASFGDGL